MEARRSSGASSANNATTVAPRLPWKRPTPDDGRLEWEQRRSQTLSGDAHGQRGENDRQSAPSPYYVTQPSPERRSERHRDAERGERAADERGQPVAGASIEPLDQDGEKLSVERDAEDGEKVQAENADDQPRGEDIARRLPEHGRHCGSGRRATMPLVDCQRQQQAGQGGCDAVTEEQWSDAKRLRDIAANQRANR